MKKSDALAKALAEALAEEERTQQKFGDDQEDGAVIAFRVRFSKGGVNYDYAALRSQGLWYTTGPKSPKGFTWQELTEWLDEVHRVSKITVLREGKATENAKQRVARAQHPAADSTESALAHMTEARDNARDEVGRLSAAVRRVRELHRESNGSLSALYPDPICGCGKDYPCPTVRALAEDHQ